MCSDGELDAGLVDAVGAGKDGDFVTKLKLGVAVDDDRRSVPRQLEEQHVGR